MKYLIVIFCLFFGCSNRNCGKLIFDKQKKITFLNEIPYTGSCNSYFITGNIKSVQSYLDGKDHGNWIFYYSNGIIQTKGRFDNGHRVGKWEYFFHNGIIFKENFYSSNGEKVGIWKQYNSEGILVNESNEANN